MEKIMEALQSTNTNIEKLIYLLTAQNKQQKLLTQIVLEQTQNSNKLEDLPLTTLTEDQNSFANAYQNFTDLLNLVGNSYQMIENSIQKLSNSYHFMEESIGANGNSFHQRVNDVSMDSNSYQSSKNEMPSNGNSYNNLMEGVSNVLASTLQTMVGVPNNVLQQPEVTGIDINTIDHLKYMAGLRAAMLKCNNDSVKNAGIILKQLYLIPKQTHKELMKLTGLSVDGMAKHVRMLKKRELVHRTGYQQYELTEKSLEILRGGMG